MDRDAASRYARRSFRRLSPAERLSRFAALQQELVERLHKSPDGLRAFMRRQVHQRAVRAKDHE